MILLHLLIVNIYGFSLLYQSVHVITKIFILSHERGKKQESNFKRQSFKVSPEQKQSFKVQTTLMLKSLAHFDRIYTMYRVSSPCSHEQHLIFV